MRSKRGNAMLTEQILLQSIVILCIVQIFGYLCGRIGQQWVIGEILAGLALGPSFLGALSPSIEHAAFPPFAASTLQTLGDLGLILYMFALGARLDIHLMLRQSRKAILISASGILLPLFLGGILALFLFPLLAGPKAVLASFLLMVGTAISITAFPVLARFLVEKKILETRVGILALTCAAVDDVSAWCLLALVISVAQANGLLSAALSIFLTILFIVCMLTIVRLLLAYAERHISSTKMLVVLCTILPLLAAYTTSIIGIHPVFGAFLAGIILPGKARLVELVRSIDKINMILFLPFYFVYSGLHTQIRLLNAPWLWLICLLVLAIACIGKIFGGTFSMRFTGETWRDSFTLGILMNTRGLVELIVLNIGLNLGILSAQLFAILVIMALLTTMMASPLLWIQGFRQTSSPKTNNEIQDFRSLEEISHS